jgi:hypothetical protein
MKGHTGYLRMIGRGPVVEPVSVATAERIRPWWRPGTKWGLLLDEAVALPEPIPMRGAGGVWRITATWNDEFRGAAHPVAELAQEQWRKGRAAR